MITYEYQMKPPYLWRRENREHPETGLAPISMRIEITGWPRAEFTTGVKATAATWNSAAQRLRATRGMSKEEQELLDLANKKLAKRIAQVERAYDSYKNQGSDPSPAELRELLRGTVRQHTLLDALDLLIAHAERKKRRAKTISNMTHTRAQYEAYLRHLKTSTVRLIQVDRVWLRAFERWCIGRGIGGRSIRMYIAQLSKALNMAVDEGYLKTNETLNYTYESDIAVPEKRHLSLADIALLAAHQFEQEGLQRVTHLFLFCYYTGLSYCDYIRFAKTPESFLKTEEGIQGIAMQRQKVERYEQEFWVPLRPEAQALRTRYRNELPQYSQSHINNVLKTIAQQVGLSLLDLKHKDARSSFSQHMRDKYGLEVAAGMAGHSENMAQKHYNSISPKRIVEQIKILGGLLTDN